MHRLAGTDLLGQSHPVQGQGGGGQFIAMDGPDHQHPLRGSRVLGLRRGHIAPGQGQALHRLRPTGGQLGRQAQRGGQRRPALQPRGANGG